MNQHVPDWNLEDESRYYNDILPKADETKPMGELIELLWQDGHVVMHSQNLQKASSITGEFKPVQEPEPARRCEKPLGSSINFIQDNESLSWFQNPLDDSLEKEFCSEFFSEMAGIDAAGLNKRNNNVIAEDEKFVKFGATNKSNVFTDSVLHQATLHLQDNIMPPPKLQGSKRPASCLENGNALNFSHFSRSLRGKLREKGSGSGTKVGGQGSTMMTVGSSICGSNPIHSHADLSSDVDGVAGGPNEGAQIWLPSESVRKQVYETTLASSSGGSGFSVRKIGEQGDSNQCHKRKERDVEGLEYQSEEAEYESSEGKKPAQGSISTRRSRASEVHNLSERRRRDRINEKMKALQELIPHCNKTDKASMLDEAIEYLKSLQLQVQMMWMGSGMAHMMFPGIQQYMSGMGMGIARAPVPSMHHTVRLPSVPVVDQSVGSSSTTNQTLFCPSSALHAVDFGNLMRSAHLQESYAPYLGFHYLQSHSQAMNLCAFGSHIAQQNQASAAPSSFTLPSAGQAPNCENNHEGESG